MKTLDRYLVKEDIFVKSAVLLLKETPKSVCQENELPAQLKFQLVLEKMKMEKERLARMKMEQEREKMIMEKEREKRQLEKESTLDGGWSGIDHPWDLIPKLVSD